MKTEINVGASITTLMKDRNIPVSWVMDKLSISQPAVWTMMNSNSMRTARLSIIAELFDVTPCELIEYGTEERKSL